MEELEIEKSRRDSILGYLAQRELKLLRSVDNDKKTIAAAINTGLIDQIRVDTSN